MTTIAARRRPRRRDAVANHESILAAAAAVLNHDPDASLEAIARHAGLSRRAVYGHFASRDHLLEELLVRGATRLNRLLTSSRNADPRVAIALLGAHLWAEVDSVRVLAQLAVRGPHRDLVARALEPLRSRVRDICADGIEASVFRQDIEPASLARLVEGTAMSVLDEATRTFLSGERGHRLVMLSTLGIAGLGWREASALIESVPELRWGAA